MNKASQLKNRLTGKKSAPSIMQRIDAAEKKRDRARASLLPDAIVVSPAGEMTAAYAVIGYILRSLCAFVGVLGLNLFLLDALKIVILAKRSSGSMPDSSVVPLSLVVIVSAAVTLLCALLALNRVTFALTPLIAALVGGGCTLLIAPEIVSFAAQAVRRLCDVVLSNLGEAGYTAYMQYISSDGFSYDTALLLRWAVSLVVVFSGVVFCMLVMRRVRAVGVGVVCAIYMVPVFVFNITRTNNGLACLLVALCGLIALYLFDCIYGGVFAERKRRKEEKAENKRIQKAAEKQRREEKRKLHNTAVGVYNIALEKGLPPAAARKQRDAVYAADRLKKEKEKKALTEEKRAERINAADKKKEAKTAAREKKLAVREEKQKYLAQIGAAKRAKNADAREKLPELRAEYKAYLKSLRASGDPAKAERMKTVAAGGYAAGMAMVIAFLAVWIPLAAVKSNFPIINVINRRMQLARTYVTAYLMGDDVDLNSLAMYGGVAELNPRNVDFNTPQYTGQRLFTVDVSYQGPVYLRSWIGSDYDIETDHWSSADAERVIAYRERFGRAYTPDNITYFFNKYVYPNALDVKRVNQYRSLDDYGFRVFQVHVTRISGTSKILFIPSIMNTELGVMGYNSLEPTEMKYSAYYDGIYSSRFYDEGTSYSVSAFNPVMKSPKIAENYEKSIEYYNMAKRYTDTIDQIESEIAGNSLFDETKEYTYVTPVGEVTMIGYDFSSLSDSFERDVAELGYEYKVESLVTMYLGMTRSERAQFRAAFDTELNYRDYAEETYTASFGSEKISALADEILADNGIVKGEKYVHDKSYLENLRENQIKRLTAEEKYGNVYESWFTDSATGETVPRHNVVMSVINYLRENYTYTLDPECPQTELLDEDGNVVTDENGEPVTVDLITADSNLDAFLFDIKQGYCVHFATSAAALLREMGFAVRYDEGYVASGYYRTYDKNAAANYRTSVRDYDAHAWIEVYYPAMGWVMYECTPSYCTAMYDNESAQEPSIGAVIDPNKVTVRDNTPDNTADDARLGTDEEVDYTAIYISIAAVVFVIIVISIVWAVLKSRAGKAVKKRAELIAAARNEENWFAGKTDVHACARSITDAVLDILEGLGVGKRTGELPTEYAVRVSEDYSDISKHRFTDVMDIIEKEEFGGKLSYRELCTLADYLADIASSVYAGLPAADRFRMRYIKNII